MFNFVTNCQTVFQNDCIILHFHQQWMRVPVTLYPQQHSVLSVFWILTILIGVWYLILVLVCSSELMCEIEHIFICLLVIRIFYGSFLSDPLPFFIGLFIFL